MTKTERAHEYLHQFTTPGQLDTEMAKHLGEELLRYLNGYAAQTAEHNPDAEPEDLAALGLILGFLAGMNEVRSEKFLNRFGGFLP